jgi:hypothetical protein
MKESKSEFLCTDSTALADSKAEFSLNTGIGDNITVRNLEISRTRDRRKKQ